MKNLYRIFMSALVFLCVISGYAVYADADTSSGEKLIVVIMCTGLAVLGIGNVYDSVRTEVIERKL